MDAQVIHLDIFFRDLPGNAREAAIVMMHLHTFYFLHGEWQYDFIFTSNISGKIPFTFKVFFNAFFILKCKVVVYCKHCYNEEIKKKPHIFIS